MIGRTVSLTWLCLALLLGAVDPGNDREKIQGTWVVARSERDGAPIPSDELRGKQVRLVFRGGEVQARMGDKLTSLGTFTLDPAALPKGYDRVYPDGTPRLGIYQLDGDTLMICFGGIGKERPSAFATKPGDGASLVVYRRETP